MFCSLTIKAELVARRFTCLHWGWLFMSSYDFYLYSGLWFLTPQTEKTPTNSSNPILQPGIFGQNVSLKRHHWSAPGMTGKGDRYQQPCEGVTEKVIEQSAWIDMTGRYHKISRMGLKQGHLWNLHVRKKVPTSHHYGEILKNSFWEINMLEYHSEVHVH